MNLYLISQDANNGYDTYDRAVVAAESEDDARSIHPSDSKTDWNGAEGPYGSWASKEHVKVDHIGLAAPDIPRGVVCASFNAG